MALPTADEWVAALKAAETAAGRRARTLVISTDNDSRSELLVVITLHEEVLTLEFGGGAERLTIPLVNITAANIANPELLEFSVGDTTYTIFSTNH